LYIDLVTNAENIPFHLKFTDDMVVFNSKQNTAWLNEVKLIPNPLVVNNSFMINILIDINQAFNVNISNRYLFI
jgi:hypothetical protein